MTSYDNTTGWNGDAEGTQDSGSGFSLPANVGQAERIASVVSGAALTLLGLRHIRSGGAGSIAMAATGGVLLFRGISGYCPINAAVGRDTANTGLEEGLQIDARVTINRPRPEVYAFWRKLENLPLFMKHLAEVRQLDTRRSHWVAKIAGIENPLEWDAEIINEEEGHRLSWQSLPDSVIDTAGEVIFTDSLDGKGTTVEAHFSYTPPMAGITEPIAKLFNPLVKKMVKKDIRRFKAYMETGEAPGMDE